MVRKAPPETNNKAEAVAKDLEHKRAYPNQIISDD